MVFFLMFQSHSLDNADVVKVAHQLGLGIGTRLGLIVHRVDQLLEGELLSGSVVSHQVHHGVRATAEQITFSDIVHDCRHNISLVDFNSEYK